MAAGRAHRNTGHLRRAARGFHLRGMFLRRDVRNSEATLIGLALALGVVVGLATLILRELVAFLHQINFDLAYGSYLSAQVHIDVLRLALVPLAGGALLGLTTFALNRFRPTEMIDPVEANALYGGQLSLRDSARLTGLTVVSNAAGASVGMEAGYSQLGSGLFSSVGRYFHLRREDQRMMVTAGAAAAIAAAFNAPLAGAFYGFELIHGNYSTRLLAPVTAASVAGAMIVRLVGTGQPLFEVAGNLAIPAYFYALFAIVGIFAAGLGVLAMQSASWVERAFRATNVPACVRPAIGGAILSLIALGSPQVLGSGHGAIDWHLTTQLAAIPIALLLVGKLAASAVSLGSGFRGGLFSSSLFLGCLLGILCEQSLAFIDTSFALARTSFILVGMGAVGAAIIGAPFTMVFLVLEATGDFQITLGVLISVIISSTLVRLTFGYSFSTWRFHLRGLPLRGGYDIGWIAELTASRLMRTDVRMVPLSLPLSKLREQVPLGSNKWIFALDSHSNYAGMVDVAAAYDPDINDLIDTLLVADLATDRSKFTLPTDDIRKLLRTFAEVGVETLPVVLAPNDRRIVGALSEAHCLKRYSQELEKRRGDELGL